MWWDGSQGNYIVPKITSGSPRVSALFAGGLWVGGFDQSGNIKLAAQTYGDAIGEHDYYPGPLDENGMTTADQCSRFNRIWSTDYSDINVHRTDWAINGMIEGPVPSSILTWPGQGNPQLTDFPFK